jgi:hypothetical protein
MAESLEDLSPDADYFARESSRQRAVAEERARASDFRAGAAAGGASAAALQRGFDAGLRLAARAAGVQAAAQTLLRCALVLAAQSRLPAAPPAPALAEAASLLERLDAGARPLFRALRASGGGDEGAVSAASAAAELRAALARLREQLANVPSALAGVLVAAPDAQAALAPLYALLAEGVAAVTELEARR